MSRDGAAAGREHPPVVVLGPGRMGAQIAYDFALAGYPVWTLARQTELAEGRLDGLARKLVGWDLCAETEVSEVRGRIVVVGCAEELPLDSGLIVETVAEDLATKVSVIREVASQIKGAAVASNTSSLSISELGKGSGTGARLVGAHYWNPPLLMPLVEITPGEATAPEVVARVEGLLRDAGKDPVILRREVPGFVWNRLQFALLREAVWLVEHGVATAEVVDCVVKKGLARRWTLTGPFETAALGGTATFEAVGRNLLPELSKAGDLASLHGIASGLDCRWDEIAARRDAQLAVLASRDRYGECGEGRDGAGARRGMEAAARTREGWREEGRWGPGRKRRGKRW